VKGKARENVLELQMLQQIERDNSGSPLYAYERGAKGIDLATAVSFLKLSRRIVFVWTIIGLAVALGFTAIVTPEYTAIANLMLDARKVQVFKDAPVIGDNAIDSAQIESQVEVIRSESIARAVVVKLALYNDPEFVDDRPMLSLFLEKVFGVGAEQKPKSEEERQRAAVRSLRNNLGVRRAATSYVLDVSFRSTSADKAAEIANAIVDAYIVDQLNTRYEATKRASGWLQERIEELQNQSDAAARAVQEFKTKNNLVDVGTHGLVSDQQLQEINSQLVIATSHTAEMRARLDRVEALLSAPTPESAIGTVAETLTSPVIVRLRQQFLDVRKREAEISLRYGSTHAAAINLRNEMVELQRSILNELKRIADSYRSDYEIAKTREESIQASLAALVKQAEKTGNSQVRLKALEGSSTTYRTILENFLQKFTEAVQQQSFPISDARLITSAESPVSPSFPKKTLLALLGLLAGAGCGVTHALIVRSLDRAIRTPREIDERFGFECLSIVPELRISSSARSGQLPKQIAIRPGGDSNLALPVAQQIQDRDGTMRRAVVEPLSRFAESLRSVKTSVDMTATSGSGRVIGILSALPGEGKSTISANLAALFAHSGARTLLIDGDLRKPTLSRTLAPRAGCGLLEVLQGDAPVDQALWSDEVTGLKFLPGGRSHNVTNFTDLLASDRIKTLLNELSERFDYIIFDLPPLGAAADARAISPYIDSFLVVIEWGRTRRDVLAEALAGIWPAKDKIIGGILNKVRYRDLNNAYGYAPGYYYNVAYRAYSGSLDN
jgi:succinoglycan biosynthesis transport protein ExoP